MQIWDEISSNLPSVTLGHIALGYKEALAPGWATPLPLQTSVDFREVFKFPCQEPPNRPEPWEPASFLDLSPQVSLAFGTHSFEKNYLEQPKISKQTNKKIKTIAQTSCWTAPCQSFTSAGEFLCCYMSLSRNLVITITSMNRCTMQYVHINLKSASSCQLLDNLMRKSWGKCKNSFEFKDWFHGQLNGKKISKFI